MTKVYFKNSSFRHVYNPNVYNRYAQPQPQHFTAQNPLAKYPSAASSGGQNLPDINLIGMGLVTFGLAAGGFAYIKFKNRTPLPFDLKKLSSDEIRFLKDKVNNVSANDRQYLEELAKGMTEAFCFEGKIDSYRLASVIGSDELKNILGKLNAENFSVGGTDFQNVLNGTFRANLHVHSDYSDGTMTIETILNQAAKYADKVHAKTGEKFILALTDHDFTESSKEALKLIAQNPMKYKNLQFVAGMEKSFAHPSPNSLYGNPTEVSEVIAYSINPYCPKLTEFIDTLQKNRKNLASVILDEANAMFPSAGLSLEDAKLSDATHPKGISMDVQWTVYNYLKRKLPNEEKSINKLCKKFRPAVENDKVTFPSGYATENTLKEAVDIIKESGYGFLGIAHPAFLKEKGFSSLEAVIKEFKRLGGDTAYAAEIHYDYNNKVDKAVIERAIKACRQENLVPTAGIDNHSNNIFTSSRSNIVSQEKIQELIALN